jgi:hypothetical protein
MSYQEEDARNDIKRDWGINSSTNLNIEADLDSGLKRLFCEKPGFDLLCNIRNFIIMLSLTLIVLLIVYVFLIIFKIDDPKKFLKKNN